MKWGCTGIHLNCIQECNGDTELQEMENSLERVRTASISADEKQREAAKKEKAAHNEAVKAREDVYELELEKRGIDKQLEVSAPCI